MLYFTCAIVYPRDTEYKEVHENPPFSSVQKHPSFPGGCFCFADIEVINVQDILLSDKEYAPWLVDSLSELNIQNVRAIALVGISENGECITGYYNCNLADKAVIAANIQADALYGTVMANADQIMHKAEELEEEYGDDL